MKKGDSTKVEVESKTWGGEGRGRRIGEGGWRDWDGGVGGELINGL